MSKMFCVNDVKNLHVKKRDHCGGETHQQKIEFPLNFSPFKEQYTTLE